MPANQPLPFEENAYSQKERTAWQPLEIRRHYVEGQAAPGENVYRIPIHLTLQIPSNEFIALVAKADKEIREPEIYNPTRLPILPYAPLRRSESVSTGAPILRSDLNNFWSHKAKTPCGLGCGSPIAGKSGCCK